MYRIGIEYFGLNPDTGLFYANSVLSLSKQMDYKKGLGDAYNLMGLSYMAMKNYPTALDNYQKALKIRTEIVDKTGMAWTYNNLGLMYGNMGEIEESIKWHTKSLQIKKETSDKRGMASSYGKIGHDYSNLGNFPEALNNYLYALKIWEEDNNISQHYKQARTKMESYLTSIGEQDLPLEHFSRKHVAGFETYIKSTPVKNLNKPISRNTANNYLKKTKAIFLNAMGRDLIKSNPFAGFKMHNAPTHRTALNSPQLSALEKHDFNGSPSLQRVKDYFLFSTFCGIRFSDLMALKNENLSFDEQSGRTFISIIQQKTKIAIKVPLLAPAKKILDKYADPQKPSAYCFPRISNQRCNSYLREIRGIVGISTKFSFHCSRHTYATTVLLDHGADLKTVSDLLGHYSIVSTEGYSKTSKEKFLKVADRVEAEMS